MGSRAPPGQGPGGGGGVGELLDGSSTPLSPPGPRTGVGSDINRPIPNDLELPPTPGNSHSHGGGSKPSFRNRDSEVRTHTARKILLKCDNINICKLSPFLIKKVLDSYIGRPKQVRKLRSEELMIITVSDQQTKKLFNLKKFHEWSVKARTPYNMNTVKGVTNYPGFNEMSDDDIVNDMADVGVIECKHFKWVGRHSQQLEPSNTVILTFRSDTLPSQVEIGYEFRDVRPYIPNPLRCYHCFKFNHVNDNCTQLQLTFCSKCSKVGHKSEDCTKAVPKCVNCSEEHTAFDKSCSVFLYEKKVNEYKFTHNCSFPEARKNVPKLTKTFAQVTKETKNKLIQVNNQTNLSAEVNDKIIYPSYKWLRPEDLASGAKDGGAKPSEPAPSGEVPGAPPNGGGPRGTVPPGVAPLSKANKPHGSSTSGGAPSRGTAPKGASPRKGDSHGRGATGGGKQDKDQEMEFSQVLSRKDRGKDKSEKRKDPQNNECNKSRKK